EQAVSQVAKQRKSLVSKVRHNKVRQAVIIIVAEVRSHAGNRGAVNGKRHAGGERDFFKSPIATIVKEKIGLAIVGYKHVHEAVVIVVGKRQAHPAPHKLADARFLCDVLEGPIATVPVEGVAEALEITGMAVGAQVTP